jgi:hypothetical protein
MARRRCEALESNAMNGGERRGHAGKAIVGCFARLRTYVKVEGKNDGLSFGTHRALKRRGLLVSFTALLFRRVYCGRCISYRRYSRCVVAVALAVGLNIRS